MKRSTRKNLISLACTLSLVAIGGGVALKADNAKADELNLTNSMVASEAQLRVKTSDDDQTGNGLRFVVEAATTTLLEDATKTGTLVVPTALLEGELTVDTEHVYDFDTTADWNVYEDSACSYAYFWNMSEYSYNVELAYRGYVVIADDVYYTNVETTSLAEVALDAVQHGDTAAEEYLLDYDVVIKDANGTIATVPVQYGTALSADADFVVPTKAGHILDWGDFDPNAPVTGDTEVTVKWNSVADNLSFNSADSLKLVTATHKNGVKHVEEGDGTKAVEFTMSHNDSGIHNVVINLGGTVNIKDIDVLTIRFKITAGVEDEWYGIYFNGSDKYMYVPGGYGSFSRGVDQVNKVMNDYGTITITKAGFEKYFETSDVVLSELKFAHRSYQPASGITTMRIDYIEMGVKSFNTLKAGTKDYYVASFNTSADAAVLSTKNASYSLANGAIKETLSASWTNGGVEVNLPTALAVNDIYSMTFRWKTADAITDSNQLVVYAYDGSGTQVAYVNCHRNNYVYHTSLDVSTVQDGDWMVSTWTMKAYVANGALFRDSMNKSISKILLGSESNCSLYVDEITYRKNSDVQNVLVKDSTDEYVLADFKQDAYAFTNYSKLNIIHNNNVLTSEGRGIYFQAGGQSQYAVYNLPQTVKAGSTITLRVKIVGAHLQAFGVKADGTKIDWGHTASGSAWKNVAGEDGWITSTYTPSADIVALWFYMNDNTSQANRCVVFDTITYKPAA